MTIVAQLEKLKADRANDRDFDAQLEALRRRSAEQGAGGGAGKAPLGFDRSRELSPVARPNLVRTLAG